MYHLVLDGPIHVFLARPSRLDAVPVRLTLLGLDERAGRGPFPGPVRCAIGRSPLDPDRFIEFVSECEALRCGFEPVGLYRVCETWDDYIDPWPTPTDAVVATISNAQNESIDQRSGSAPAVRGALNGGCQPAPAGAGGAEIA